MEILFTWVAEHKILCWAFADARASQTVPSDLPLKLDQLRRLHTSLPFHTPRSALFFFFYLFNSRLSPLFPLCRNVLCHNSSPPHSPSLLWNWISDKIPFHRTDWTASWPVWKVSFGYIMWHNSRGVERSPWKHFSDPQPGLGLD